MNTSGDNGKIVDLQQRQNTQAVAGDRLGDLLRAVRATALKRLQGLVASLFENIDDALFDLAEKAENNAIQTQYFDGMREVRKKRQLVERVYQEQLGRIFNDFAVGKLQANKPDASKADNEGLSLVEDNELEESLAIASAVAKNENRLARPLYAMNQRLSMLRGGAKVDDATNPVGPAQLCQGFRVAMRELDLNLQTQLIIYKLFDRYVMVGLDALYEEIGAQLIQAGVLPQIRHVVAGTGARGPRPPAPLPPGAPPPMEGDAPPPGDPGYAPYAAQYDPAAAQLQAELYNTVRGLLASRRASLPPGDGNATDYAPGPPGVGVPYIAPTDLLSALTLLQNQAWAAQSSASSAADAAQAVQQIKQELLDQAGKLHGTDKAHVAGADEDTIDLVGMLFEYILQDRNLPPQMQALLGRLQIPFLKAAILDKHLFAQKSHPARQLLDAMAQASMGWSEEADKDHRLYDKVKQTVEDLLKNFDDDLDIFETTRTDFETFLEGNRKRADLAEQRVAEATRGREKLHSARRISAREILQRVEGREMPEIVRTVLTRPWANYLVLTLLRQGQDSNEWRQALRFADEFVWSAQPKASDADRLRLKGILPALEKSLRHGLATVAYHENDVKQLMHELNAFYTKVLHGDAPVAAEAAVLASEAAAPGFEIVGTAAATAAAIDSPVEEEIVLRAEAEAAPPDLGEDDDSLRQVKSMKVGTWVEFTGTDGGKERAKLSWISPISAKYLFVNRKGLKVADKTVQALAIEIRRGDAAILEEVPLFDRALDAIVERLKAAHAKPEAPAA
ncbi:MAG: DUF1631 domain-containing protein [Proteobacteria bacterium]|nr:DUF1631 domain-containing protein [Pseudomonadota bacterium]